MYMFYLFYMGGGGILQGLLSVVKVNLSLYVTSSEGSRVHLQLFLFSFLRFRVGMGGGAGQK